MRHPLAAVLALALLAAVAPSPAHAPAEPPAQTPPPPAQPAPAPTPAPVPAWTPRVAAARRYALSRAGTVAFAVRTPARSWGFRRTRAYRSASVVKAMLMAAYLRRPDVRGRALREDERATLAPMIRWSDNAAAQRLHLLMGTAALARLAERARMARFTPAPAWGLSQITAADQTRFFLRLPELLPRRHRAYALRLLRTIVPEQRWGLARAVPRGWRAHFKGGWGSGTGAVSHQVALLRRGEERVAVAVLTAGNPSHAYAAETLRGVAARLLRGLGEAESVDGVPTAR